MDKEKLAPWIERLGKAGKKDRAAIVAEMCKEHGLKTADAWKLLKDAGFNPDADPSSTDAAAEAQAEKTTPVQLRSKTEYPQYRCAGLVLKQKAETYEVTAAQFEKLQHDPWVEIVKPEGAEKK